ncbi:RNA polymerase I-specific transcription initiation factor RRN3 [Gautieria morchelliformis]|nr:RNA polymerase I-specific transcription initiation factor RRN3 [Gautieria morchelliformis]
MFHSNSSPFNQRQPKAGPSTIPLRHHQDSTQKSMENPNLKRSTAASKDGIATQRPVISNSRVKQDEKYRKDMYLVFVNNALLQKSKGIVEPFDELVSQFLPGSESSGAGASVMQLRLWVSALSHVVSQLERTHSALVEAVINMPWVTMDSIFVKSYISFVGMLVSARPEYLSLVLEKTARGFTFRSSLHAIHGSVPEGSSSPLTRRVVYDRLHCLLEHLLSLVPTLPSTLQPLLVRNFPHKRQEKADQQTYIQNLLRVTEYCPALADRILATIIDRAIQIDVEIQVEIEEIEVNDSSRDNEELFTLDPFDTVVGQEGSDSEDEEGYDGNLSDLSSDAGDDADDEESPIEVEQDITHVRDMVSKLDAMLKLLFDHFHRTHSSLTTIHSPSAAHDPQTNTIFTASPSRPPPVPRATPERGYDLRRSQFITLLSIFDRTILRTFKSRYTQFLIFWYSSLDPEFADIFQGTLLSKALFEGAQPIVTRAAAASYIASFVSRARFVGDDSAKQVMGLLCDFLEAHLDICDASGEAFDPLAAQHTLFYAVAQAAFLIFCFRWRDLQVDDELEMDDLGIDSTSHKKWIPKLDVMQRVVSSTLNPLKVCSPNVVEQFARVAQSTGFIYCYTILENNRRLDPHGSNTSTPLKSPPSSAKHHTPRSQHVQLLRDAADADLTTFFPFDPYRLPLSVSYIQGIYREWGSVALDDEEEEEEEEEAEEVQSSTLKPWPIGDGGDDTDALGASFGGMSISPVRPNSFQRSTVRV